MHDRCRSGFIPRFRLIVDRGVKPLLRVASVLFSIQYGCVPRKVHLLPRQRLVHAGDSARLYPFAGDENRHRFSGEAAFVLK